MYEADRALVTRMRAGDQRAFHEFFDASASRLFAFAARRTSLDSASLEDIVQGSLIKAVRNLAGYRGEAALFTWLSEICRHEIADVHRKAARRPVHLSMDQDKSTRHAVAELRIPAHDEPVAQLDGAKCRAAVMQILSSLPEQYGHALEAKYGDGLSVEDIADQLGLTVIAAQSLLARARAAFRERWRQAVDRVAVGEVSR